jgi:hypothetical protein
LPRSIRINYASAKYIVQHLIEVGAIEEVTGRKYGKVCAASKVIDIVDEV